MKRHNDLNLAISKAKSLVDPIIIGNCRIKNRLGLGPINSGLFGRNGDASEGCKSFYKQYFEDGLGLVYIGGVAVSLDGKANDHSLLLDSEEKCNGLKTITSLAHEYDTNIVVQLMHAGRQTNPDEIGVPNVAPSAIPCPVVGKKPFELDKDGIQRIIKAFSLAARLAEQSGVDAIELHGAHGYLIAGFLSPYSNRRNDEYGGSLENRFRFLQEILLEITKSVSIPIGVRLNCFENAENGLTLEEVIQGAREFIVDFIDYIDVSAGVYSPGDVIIPSREMGKALWRLQSAELKRQLSITVMLTGNIDSLDVANEILAQGQADVILVVRTLLADPQFFSKSLRGQKSSIQECTDCRECKYHSRGKDFVYCPFNKVLVDLHREYCCTRSVA